MSDPAAAAAVEQPVWRTCLDVEGQAADHYDDFVLTPLFDIMAHEPARVLELGCAGGAFGAELKNRFPAASVVGIDAGAAAAQKAASRLDRVIHARLDQCNLAQAGLKHGEFDTLVAADILEHLVNPWALLERIKPFLAPGAQVLVSIPNARNITVGSELLVGGRFEYAQRGLLDVTHLRFFTLDSIRRMFEETGYVVQAQRSILLPALRKLYEGYSGAGPVTLRFGRMTISDVTAQEVMELCAAQFVLRCRPA